MKKIYIAGKVSGEPIRDVAIKFAKAYSEIDKLGFIPINPVELVQNYFIKNFAFQTLTEDEEWKIAMQVCIKELVECDGVLLLPGNLESRGATIERQLAQGLDIPTFYDINKFTELWNSSQPIEQKAKK